MVMYVKYFRFYRTTAYLGVPIGVPRVARVRDRGVLLKGPVAARSGRR